MKSGKEHYKIYKDKILAYHSKRAKQEVAELRDSYILRLLKLRGFKNITNEMIETKRQQLIEFRKTKQNANKLNS